MAFGSLAELYVEVKPDTSKFGRQLVRDLERKHRRGITIPIKPDTKRFTVEARRSAAFAGRAAGRAYNDSFARSAGSLTSSMRRGTRGLAGIAAGAIGSAAKVAAVGIGAATAATAYGFAKATQKAGAFDKTMRMAGQTMQASGGQLKSLTDLAIEMGAKTSFSAKGAADAMYELAKGGMRPAQIRAGALKETLVLAAAGGLELGESAEYMVKSLGAFRLKARDARRVSSALAGAANASSASVQDMGLALAQVSASAAASGQSIEETTAALAAFHNAGVRGSDAGTSLKTMLARLTPNTEKATGAMEKLGIITEDGKNQFFTAKGEMKSLSEVAGILDKAFSGLSDKQRIQAMNTIFGSDATRAATILMNEGKTGIEKYEKATRDQTQAQKLAKTATEGYAGALERFKGSVESIQIIAGKAFLPGVTSTLNSISTWLGENQDDIKTVFTVAAQSIQEFGTQATEVFRAFVGALTGGDVSFQSFTTALVESQVDITKFGSSAIETFVNIGSATTSWMSGTIRSLGEADLAFADTLRTVGFIAAAFAVLPTTSAGAREALLNVANASQQQAYEIRQSGNAQIATADAMDKRLIPAMEAARAKAKELAAQAVVRAEAQQKANEVAAAINKIGESGDYAKLKLKGYNIESGKGTAKQKAFAARVREARSGLIEQYKSAATAKVSHKAFNKIVKAGEDALYQEFLQMGYSSEEARVLAKKYSKVPKKIETKIKQPGMKTAQDNLKEYDELSEKAQRDRTLELTTKFRVSQSKAVAKLLQNVPESERSGFANQLAGMGYAQGGYTGKGAPREIAGVVHADEQVIKSESRRRIERKHPGALDYMNEYGDLPGYLSGGFVTRMPQKGQKKAATAQVQWRKLAIKTQDSLAAGWSLAAKNMQDKLNADLSTAGAGTGSKKRVRWHGGTFTERFANTLKAAQRIDGHYLPVIQGGFRPRTSYSGSSHAGDAVDTGWDRSRQAAMRRAGIYAPHRTPAQGPWGHHIHGIPKKGFGYPAGSGLWQQGDFARGGNGLHTGGSFQNAGWAKVGERGPEYIQGNKGDRVVPAERPIYIELHQDGLVTTIQGVIDDNDEFRAGIGRLSR